MAWLFNPLINWVTAPRNPTAADLDNIARDHRTWGGNVDGGGYGLSNISSLTVTGGAGTCVDVISSAGSRWRLGDGVGAANGVFVLYDYTHSAARVAVSPAGWVGIGTTSPQRFFHAKTSTTGETVGWFHHGGDADHPGHGLQVSNGYALAAGAYEVFGVFANNFTVPIFHIRDNGRVGIGTAAPTSNLQVVGLPSYASNAAAMAGGLTAGAMYIVTGTSPAQVAVVT